MRSFISNFDGHERTFYRALHHLAMLVLVLFSFFIVDRLLDICFSRLTMQSQIRFSRLYSGAIDADILVLGNSRGVNSIYTPDVENRLGMKTFNLSYNGMGIVLAQSIFEDYLENNPAPSLLVIEATNINVDSKLINNLKLYTHYSHRLKELFRTEYPREYAACQLSRLYCYNSEFFLRVLYFIDKNDQTWINRHKVDPGFVSSYMPGPQSGQMFAQISPSKLNALLNIIDLAHKNSVEVRILIGPFLPKHILHIPQFSTWKQKLSEALPTGYKIWDYSTAITSNIAFADPVHLNYEGSRMLLNMLLGDGFFTTTVAGM